MANLDSLLWFDSFAVEHCPFTSMVFFGTYVKSPKGSKSTHWSGCLGTPDRGEAQQFFELAGSELHDHPLNY